MVSDERKRFTDEEILKSLMIGLLYPAVLGSVIVIGLDSGDRRTSIGKKCLSRT